MAIQQLCTFYLDGSYFGIGIEEVQEIIRQPPLTRIPLAPPDICGLMNLRGQVIPVVDLSCRLGLRLASCGIGEQTSYNIIVKTADDLVGLIADEVGDVLDFGGQRFEPAPANLNAHIRYFLKGAYQLNPGFLLVLDATKVLDSTRTANSLH